MNVESIKAKVASEIQRWEVDRQNNEPVLHVLDTFVAAEHQLGDRYLSAEVKRLRLHVDRFTNLKTERKRREEFDRIARLALHHIPMAVQAAQNRAERKRAPFESPRRPA